MGCQVLASGDGQTRGAAEGQPRCPGSHLVLCYQNGEGWFEVHPLVRDHVRRRAAEMAGQAKPLAREDGDGRAVHLGTEGAGFDAQPVANLEHPRVEVLLDEAHGQPPCLSLTQGEGDTGDGRGLS